MHQLDPEGTARDGQAGARRRLEGGEGRRHRVPGLARPDDLSFLLEQAKAKAKDVRAAALKALGKSDADDAVAALQAALKAATSSWPLRPFVTAEMPQAAEVRARRGRRSRLECPVRRQGEGQEGVGKQVERMLLAAGVPARPRRQGDGEVPARMFRQTREVGRDQGRAEWQGRRSNGWWRLWRAVSKKVQKALVDAHASLTEDDLPDAFVAACRSREPAEVFELFSPYLTAKVDEKKKKRDPAFAKRDAICGMITSNRSWRRYNFGLTSDNEADFASRTSTRGGSTWRSGSSNLALGASARPSGTRTAAHSCWPMRSTIN